MNVRVRISTNKEELTKAFEGEATGTIFGKNNISMFKVYNELTGKVTKHAHLAEIYKESNPIYHAIHIGLLPLEMVSAGDILLALFELEIDEKEDILFERKALPSDITETEFNTLVKNIKDLRVFNLEKYDKRYCQIILTRLKEENLLGVTAI